MLDDVDLMASTALPENLEAIRENSYIRDNLQLRWVVIGVEDVSRPILYEIEHVLIEAAKRES